MRRDVPISVPCRFMGTEQRKYVKCAAPFWMPFRVLFGANVNPTF